GAPRQARQLVRQEPQHARGVVPGPRHVLLDRPVRPFVIDIGQGGAGQLPAGQIEGHGLDHRGAGIDPHAEAGSPHAGAAPPSATALTAPWKSAPPLTASKRWMALTGTCSKTASPGLAGTSPSATTMQPTPPISTPIWVWSPSQLCEITVPVTAPGPSP